MGCIWIPLRVAIAWRCSKIVAIVRQDHTFEFRDLLYDWVELGSDLKTSSSVSKSNWAQLAGNWLTLAPLPMRSNCVYSTKSPMLARRLPKSSWNTKSTKRLSSAAPCQSWLSKPMIQWHRISGKVGTYDPWTDMNAWHAFHTVLLIFTYLVYFFYLIFLIYLTYLIYRSI